MRIYLEFDDTDVAGADRGTGKLARWFEEKLPEGARQWGVIRQQLPRLPDIPFTSNNSAACVVVDIEDEAFTNVIVEKAVEHIAEHFIDGSDPGLCVLCANSTRIPELVEFGRAACTRVMTQKEAMKAVGNGHLSGHGGTNDGIIGAVAGVGLTLYGWSGRFVEFGKLREFPNSVRVKNLEDNGIKVLSIDRNALVPGPEDTVETYGWLRPNQWGFQPVLPVVSGGSNRWEVVAKKKPNKRMEASPAFFLLKSFPKKFEKNTSSRYLACRSEKRKVSIKLNKKAGIKREN